jgi:hypothetical protein
MDPSEEIEFERKMMSNENLLIEVESLRSTYNKTKTLPIKQAPKYLLDRVKEQAVLEQKKKLKKSNKVIDWLGKSVAVAATILLLVSLGMYFSALEPSSTTPKNLTSQINNASTIQPWVDRNEIIKVSDRIDALKAQNIGEEYEKSYEKLIPVNSPSQLSKQRQGVLLTSSPVSE